MLHCLRVRRVAGDLGASVASTLIASLVLVSAQGSSDSVMSVMGVYLPCLDLGIDYYREHLVSSHSAY